MIASHAELSESLISAAIEVHRILGFGLAKAYPKAKDAPAGLLLSLSHRPLRERIRRVAN